MSIEICKTKNPLIRDGTSQSQRQLVQLHPRHARIDERLLADFMNYAADYARELQYYDSQNNPSGDWLDFFDRDVASVISRVAGSDNSAYRELYYTARDIFGKAESASEIKNSGAFEVLFDLVFQLSSEFNGWILKATADDNFKRHLERLISSQLRDSLSNAIAAYNQAQEYNWFNQAENPQITFEFDRKKVFDQAYSSLWQAQGDGNLYTLGEWVNASEKDNALFDYPSPSTFIRLKKAGETLLNWVNTFLQAQTQLINDAPGYLFNVIHHWPQHKPHTALYIAFIRLFKYAQIHLNSLTARHLDHYYRNILGFKPLSSTRDRVHVLFELAKQKDIHLLKQGTLLKAGFDDLGNPVEYALERELSVNRAYIDQAGDIKSVYIDRTEGQGCRIYSAAMTNSKDGKGGEFAEGEVKWKPFLQAQLSQGVLVEEPFRTADLAEVGFAFSSPLFDLREGLRTITVKIFTDASPVSALDTGQIGVRLSGEKDWIEADIKAFEYQTDHIFLQVELDPSLGPVVRFDSELLSSRNYQTEFPVLEVILQHDLENNKPFAYEGLKDLILVSLDIGVQVDGMSNLIVQSDLGRLDSSKPFQPFGPRPVVGSSFYIGSEEAFLKPVTRIQLEYDWLDAPIPFSDHYQIYNDDLSTGFDDSSFQVSISSLNDREWLPVLDSDVEIFNSANPDGPGQRITIDAEQDANGDYLYLFKSSPGIAPMTGYNNQLVQGFIKWQLTAPEQAFGHKLYTQVYAARVVLLTKVDDTKLPNEPYTPVINKLSLNYTAEISQDIQGLVQQENHSIYHIYPFGTVKLSARDGESPGLLPVFKTVVDEVEQENNGELYIGLNEVKPPQIVSLFFQVAEGSADPEFNREPIHWSILQDDRWLSLEKKQIVYNSTNDFNTSGIVSISIPNNIQHKSSILPGGKIWLKASVLKNTPAVSQFIEIGSQVGEAAFYNRNNDENFLAAPLPADSIAKLVVKQSAIKSVRQPYASVHGQAPESSAAFNIRVSERLRHKDRSISIWDYEKIVLQQFKDVFKVKCINHSTYVYERAENDYFTSEFAPGYITLIVIPDLGNQNAVNPLEPRASLDRLDTIKSFLQKRMTPFAASKLRVINPLYESIQLEMTVSFHPEYDPAAYREILNQDIKEYLSPWAFYQNRRKDIIFGGKIHRSILLNFVEERNYVDFITEFKMHQHADTSDDSAEQDNRIFFDIHEAVPTSARTIFVSHARHLIIPGDSC